MPIPSDSPTQPARLLVPGLLLIALVLFLPALGKRDWWYPDEPDVALPAIEMDANDDWIVPTQNGTVWLDYPPLAYWGARLAGLVTGEIDPLSTRLPMLAFFGILLIATVQLGRRLTEERTAGLAGVISLGTPLLWFQATHVQVDLGFAAALALGMLAYLRGDTRTGAGSWVWRATAFACFGLAILAKGPLGVLLPGLILTCWHAWNREWRRLLQLAPLALVAVAMALPWYLLLAQRLGTDVMLRELYLQNFDRFGNVDRGHGEHGPFYYITALLADFLPWSLLLLPVFWSGFAQQRHNRSWRLLAVWVLAPLLFFSLASTKRNVYLLPVYPALAVLVADWLWRAAPGWQTRWRTVVALGWSGLLAGLGATMVLAAAGWSQITPLVATSRLGPDLAAALRPGVLMVGLVFLVLGACALREARARRLLAWPLMAAGGAIAWSVCMHLVLPVIDRQRSYEPASAWLAERVPERGTIGYFWPERENTKRPAWLCHLEGRRLIFFREASAASVWLAQDPRRLLLTTPPLLPTIRGASQVTSWTISSTVWSVVKRQNGP